ncbi:hypothetical protein NLJ89_g10279 [Agrocybe chaxingu]|uniref:Ferric oxidoreductase domain-containing protein n=1 Tax=Agrocybe chaxingu TaxID=84603 RepID=A0A9W8JRK6_9AGAR|nr:hypothetical protein NLJ89_g10279 [Agrocybe chaxingu]
MATLAPTAAPANNVDDASLVYHVNLLLIALVALFIVIKLPRAFALFGTKSEWLNGHILRYIPYRPSRRGVQAIHSAYPPPDSKEYSSNDSHTLYTHARHAQRLAENGAPVAMYFPPHVPSCIKPLRPLLTPLRSRISPGFSVAQLLLLIIYFYALVYAGFYRSNIFTDTARTGWIAVAQMPLVYAFAQKNNVLGSLLGYGYEKLNFLHRFAGRMVIIAANIHSLHYFFKWSLEGTFKQSMKRPNAIWGLIALLCLDALAFFSTAYWRKKAYNLFLSTHVISLIIVLPATYKHKPTVLPYILACVGIYLFDRLFRVIKSRITIAHIRPLPRA